MVENVERRKVELDSFHQIDELQRAMIEAAQDGPDGATKVALHARNMVFFAEIARTQSGEDTIARQGEFRPEEGGTKDYAVDRVAALMGHLRHMVGIDSGELPKKAAHIVSTLVPIYIKPDVDYSEQK